MAIEAERALESRLGVVFADQALLRVALTHRSLLHERKDEESNERLEFLGDAFLGLVIAEELYYHFPRASEGQLTQMRARLVRAETLADIARELGIGESLRLGRGEEQTGGRARERNLAGALEAVVGALLLDQGYAVAQECVLALFGPLLASLSQDTVKDYKSLLQELVQAQGKPTPTYSTVKEEETGPSRSFAVEVQVNGEPLGRGMGASKRKAEQAAAREAYVRLNGG